MPNVCPLTDKKMGELAEMVRGLPGWEANVRLLSVSFDPEHDTPETLAKHAALRSAKPPLWTFAVADHPELAKVTGPLGLIYVPREGEVTHNLSTAVIDPEGRLVRLVVGGPTAGQAWTPAGFARAMKPFVVSLRK